MKKPGFSSCAIDCHGWATNRNSTPTNTPEKVEIPEAIGKPFSKVDPMRFISSFSA
ncbi:MAG: hypothetical protein R3F31_18055 [Verrucomicrobiales bacterium]